jgi:hypothetical protein
MGRGVRATIKPARNTCVTPKERTFPLAEKQLYKSENLGSGTFVITKPKRKKAKLRQTRLKNLKRGSRK